MLPDEGAELTEDQVDEAIMAKLEEHESKSAPTQAETKEVEEVEADAETEEVKEEDDTETKTEKPEEESEDPEKEAEQSELTLAEIAEVLGVEEDQLDVDENNKVVLKTKIDGVEGKVSLAEARKSYQLEGHLNKQNMEVVETRKAIAAEREQFQQEHQLKAQRLEDTLQLANNELNYNYQSIDWNALKITDPNQFLILKNEFQERQGSIQQAHQQLAQDKEQQIQQFHAERLEKLNAETETLRSSVPGWDNDETYKAGTQEIRNHLIETGWSEQEIQSISLGIAMPPDAARRFLIQAHKATQFEKLQKSNSEVIKKIRKAPKIVRSGTFAKQSSETSLKQSIAHTKKTGEISDDYLKSKGLI